MGNETTRAIKRVFVEPPTEYEVRREINRTRYFFEREKEKNIQLGRMHIAFDYHKRLQLVDRIEQQHHAAQADLVQMRLVGTYLDHLEYVTDQLKQLHQTVTGNHVGTTAAFEVVSGQVNDHRDEFVSETTPLTSIPLQRDEGEYEAFLALALPKAPTGRIEGSTEESELFTSL